MWGIYRRGWRASAALASPGGLVVLAAFLLLGGCSGLGTVPAAHVAMFDKRGALVDPTGNAGCTEAGELCNGSHVPLRRYRAFGEDDRQRYLQDLFAELKAQAPVKDGRRQLLLFVHGGLNTRKSALKRAVELTAPILDDGPYYPIFVNWRSSLVSSYADHLLWIRQGKARPVLGLLSSPVILGIDLVRAVARAPLVWGGQLINAVSTMPVVHSPDSLMERQGRLVANYYASIPSPDSPDHPGAIAVETGEDQRCWPEMLAAGTSYLALLPLRLVSAPFIDAFGSSSWDTMLRRTRLLFHAEEEFRGGSPAQATGGLYLFLKELQEALAASEEEWEITLVGHSMGTIVLNEAVRLFPDLPYRRIVYMAAACSIRDFESSILPLLERNPCVEFYSLSLQRVAEERERWDLFGIPHFDPAIRGSLLSWIDAFLAKPLTPIDRTLGKYKNFVYADHIIPPDVRGRVHLREFNLGPHLPGIEPQKHGDFDEAGDDIACRFWDEGFYTPKRPE